jgi:hypothetical protein
MRESVRWRPSSREEFTLIVPRLLADTAFLAAIGGGGIALLVRGLCNAGAGTTTSCGAATFDAALIGGAAGFVVGALIGGAIPHSNP